MGSRGRDEIDDFLVDKRRKIYAGALLEVLFPAYHGGARFRVLAIEDLDCILLCPEDHFHSGLGLLGFSGCCDTVSRDVFENVRPCLPCWLAFNERRAGNVIFYLQGDEEATQRFLHPFRLLDHLNRGVCGQQSDLQHSGRGG